MGTPRESFRRLFGEIKSMAHDKGADRDRWFDDIFLGMRFKSADKLVTREDIKRFALEFDPQPYHLDEAAAERTPLKGLAASGWHTAAIAMRLAVEVRPFGSHPLSGSALVNDLRWLRPRTPGRCGFTSKARWSSSHHRRLNREVNRTDSNGRPSIRTANPFIPLIRIAIVPRRPNGPTVR